MTNLSLSGHLADKVAQILSINNANRFRQYWAMYEQTAEITGIQGLIVTSEENTGYFNVAIIGDGRIVDVEGNDSEGSGSLSIYPIKSVSEVTLHQGSIPSLSHSQGASLVLLLGLVGQDESGPYWTAKPPGDAEQLLKFARTLVNLVSERQGIQ